MDCASSSPGEAPAFADVSGSQRDFTTVICLPVCDITGNKGELKLGSGKCNFSTVSLSAMGIVFRKQKVSLMKTFFDILSIALG